MSTPDRRSYPQGGDGEVAAAPAEREARLATDAAQMAAGAALGHDEQTSHQGTGGHESASDPVC